MAARAEGALQRRPRLQRRSAVRPRGLHRRLPPGHRADARTLQPEVLAPGHGPVCRGDDVGRAARRHGRLPGVRRGRRGRVVRRRPDARSRQRRRTATTPTAPGPRPSGSSATCTARTPSWPATRSTPGSPCRRCGRTWSPSTAARSPATPEPASLPKCHFVRSEDELRRRRTHSSTTAHWHAGARDPTLGELMSTRCPRGRPSRPRSGPSLVGGCAQPGGTQRDQPLGLGLDPLAPDVDGWSRPRSRSRRCGAVLDRFFSGRWNQIRDLLNHPHRRRCGRPNAGRACRAPTCRRFLRLRGFDDVVPAQPPQNARAAQARAVDHGLVDTATAGSELVETARRPRECRTRACRGRPRARCRPGSTTSATQPGRHRHGDLEPARPSARRRTRSPCGVSCSADARVIPPPGRGCTRNRRQVGSTRCRPATYRCRNEITAPLE